SNGLGATEADLNSLSNYREGRLYPTGSTFGLESQHWLQFATVSIQAQPRLAIHFPRDGATEGSVRLESGSLRGVMGNVALTAGREFTLWAQAENAGLFFSENAPALDMFRLASDLPFQLPGVFRRAGLVAATLQVADLGQSAANSHSRLVSYKVSVRPTNVLELGATFENHFGGAGATNPSFLNRVFDLLPVVDIFRHHADSTDVQSDKLIGADGRLRLAGLANVTLFGEIALEDFDFHRLGSVFTEDAAYSVGVAVPAIFSPSLWGSVRYHTTGLRFYEHHLIVDGIAARRFILGDDLGHDARALNASLTLRTLPGLLLTISADHERRSNDEYLGSYVNTNLSGLVFRKVSDRPEEVRTRGVLTLRWTPPTSRVNVELGAGAERASNFGFESVPSRLHGVGNFTITAYR
ncbi:MAG: capsule assembly Wzi family protein, partial [Gemmatimonadota bacterium]|nr:capsule assembly Wzi family protein [Gemmatimonadota bacterium]